jgi:heme oxygenase
MDIKTETIEQHRNAENQEFVKTLMSGSINPELYSIYLYNLYLCYERLEIYCIENGLFRELPNIQRAPKLELDYKSLWKKNELPYTTDSTLRYLYHLNEIKSDPEKLFSHVYVRHMGDLYGGQMIRRKTPGPNSYLIFLNPEELKRIIRQSINDYYNTYQVNVVAEAKICFDYATELFKEMNDLGKSYQV